MPKRLCNSKGRTQARFGRIRISWRKARMLSQLDKLSEADEMGKLDSDGKANFENFKNRVKELVPKSMFRRHQSR